MTVPLNDWASNILSHIPSVPFPAVYTAMRKASRKFCKDTYLWTYIFDLIDVEADTALYTMDATELSTLAAELMDIPEDGVRYKEDGEDEEAFANLTCTSEAEMDAKEGGGWRYQTAPAPTKFLVDNVNKQLRLIATPDTESVEGLEVTGILMPARTCTTLPDFLYNDWEDAIEYGSLYELFRLKAMSWYSPDKAQENAMAFRDEVNKAKLRRFTGRSNKPMNVAMQFF